MLVWCNTLSLTSGLERCVSTLQFPLHSLTTPHTHTHNHTQTHKYKHTHTHTHQVQHILRLHHLWRHTRSLDIHIAYTHTHTHTHPDTPLPAAATKAASQ